MRKIVLKSFQDFLNTNINESVIISYSINLDELKELKQLSNNDIADIILYLENPLKYKNSKYFVKDSLRIRIINTESSNIRFLEYRSILDMNSPIIKVIGEFIETGGNI